jgi:hypothetical protein
MTTETSATLQTGGEIRTVSVPSKEIRELSLYAGQLTPVLGVQYSFFIMDSQTSKVSAIDAFKGLNPANAESPPEYFFEMAPQVTEVGEPFTSSIVPTQRGGKFVETHGSIIKNIMIRGTTGIRPRKQRGNFSNIPIVGEAINDLTNQFKLTDRRRDTPLGEQTGYDDIFFLRNIFRAYSDIKENNKASNNILLIWRNNKDQDSWIVEPKEFKISRNAQSPLTYEYNITLQTLAPLTVAFHKPTDPLDAVLTVRKVFSRVQEFNQSLRRTFLIVSTQIRRLEGLGVYAQTTIAKPLIEVTRGLGIIRYTGATFGRRLQHNTQVLRDNLDDAIDLLTGTPGVEPQDALVRSLRRARITCARILVEPGVRETVGGEGDGRRDRYASSYTTGGDGSNSALSAPATGGSSTFIGNARYPGRLSQGTVYNGEDIRSVAGRLLNNRSSWHILVAVNGLSSPYITHDGAGDTLKPGDLLLYPSQDEGFASGGINLANTDEAEDKDTVPEVHQAYGRDLRLVSNSVGTVDLADLYINQRGDYSTVVGVPNVSQAITIKLSTEQGELPVHPSFGVSFPIGSKVTPLAVSDFRLQSEATLYSDGRVQRINQLEFTTSGDVMLMRANITLTDKSDGLNVSVPVRRL